jgi:hypothetical protein
MSCRLRNQHDRFFPGIIDLKIPFVRGDVGRERAVGEELGAYVKHARELLMLLR